MNKKGISSVLTSVLIIFFGIAAVIVLAGLIFSDIEKSEGRIDSSYVKATKASVVTQSVKVAKYNDTASYVSFYVQRDKGVFGDNEEVVAYQVSVGTGGQTESVRVNQSLNPSETKEYTAIVSGVGGNPLITVAPIVKTEKGIEEVGSVGVYQADTPYPNKYGESTPTSEGGNIVFYTSGNIYYPRGMIGQWKFDDNLDDSLGNQAPGIKNGNVDYSNNSKLGKSLYFTGRPSDYVKINLTNYNGNSSISQCAWVKFDNFSKESNFGYIETFVNSTLLNNTKEFKMISSWETFDQTSLGLVSYIGFWDGAFDGRYSYYAPGYWYNNVANNRYVLRYDHSAPFNLASSWTYFDLGSAFGQAFGNYGGAIFDGRYVYFVPYWNATVGGFSYNFWGMVLRYDTQASFTNPASWQSFNAENVNGCPFCGGLSGGTYDGKYIYFPPRIGKNGMPHENFLRYNTQNNFTSSTSWEWFNGTKINDTLTSCGAGCNQPVWNWIGKGYNDAQYINGWVYYVPSNNAGPTTNVPIVRFNSTGAGGFNNKSNWEYQVVQQLPGMSSAGSYQSLASDGNYIYFAPGGQSPLTSVLLRYDTRKPFNNFTSWEKIDTSNILPSSIKGFKGNEFDGRYVYFAPDYESQYPPHGNVLKYDTFKNFSQIASWEFYDVTPSLSAGGFRGSLYDGRYNYFVPMSRGFSSPYSTFPGNFARFDTKARSYNVSSRFFYFSSMCSDNDYNVWSQAPAPYTCLSAGVNDPGYQWNKRKTASAQVLQNNKWYFVCAVVNASTNPSVKLYLNGSLIVNTPSSLSASIPGKPLALYIGSNSIEGYTAHAGYIDEVSLFNRSLSDQEIRDMYGTYL